MAAKVQKMVLFLIRDGKKNQDSESVIEESGINIPDLQHRCFMAKPAHMPNLVLSEADPQPGIRLL
jgi:hypothetical protein